MNRAPSRLSILCLAAFLLAAPAFAAPDRAADRDAGSLFARVLDLFGSLLAGKAPAVDKAHGTMDPNGDPAPAPASGPTSNGEGDAHGTMDPDGQP